MKSSRIIAAGLIFLALTLLKFAAPNTADTLREQLRDILCCDDDYTRALETVSAFFVPEETAAVPAAAEIVLRPVETEQRHWQAHTLRETVCIRYPEVESASEERMEEYLSRQQEEPVPEAVAAFLASQSAFADYDLPENVTYDWV